MLQPAMKTVTFNAVKDGKGYVKPMLVPAHSREAKRTDKVGLAIAGGLLVITAAFVTMMLLAL